MREEGKKERKEGNEIGEKERKEKMRGEEKREGIGGKEKNKK